MPPSKYQQTRHKKALKPSDKVKEVLERAYRRRSAEVLDDSDDALYGTRRGLLVTSAKVSRPLLEKPVEISKQATQPDDSDVATFDFNTPVEMVRTTASGRTQVWTLHPRLDDLKIIRTWGMKHGNNQSSELNVVGTKRQSAERVFETKVFSLVGKQLDKGYEFADQSTMALFASSDKGKVWTKRTAGEFPRPMLATILKRTAAKVPHMIGSRLLSQPKLDGIRCLAKLDLQSPRTSPILYSRGAKLWTHLTHIQADLSYLATAAKKIGMNGILYLDGELYTHSEHLTFQHISGLVSRTPANKHEEDMMHLLSYHVFDCFFEGKESDAFEDRFANLADLEFGKWSHLELVDTNEVPHAKEGCHAATDMWELTEKYMKQGYEGMMLRDPTAPYMQNRRSPGLIKCKLFDDDEFEIVGWSEGVGKSAGTVIWECRSNEGDFKTFRARPVGTAEELMMLLRTAYKYIGKMLTVRYQGLSVDGVPRFPVAVGVRDHE